MKENVDVSRRQVLKGAGVAAIGAAAGLLPTGKALAARAKAPRWAFIVDLRRCTGCRSCTVACKAEFNTPLGAFRAAVYEEVHGKYPNSEKLFLPRLCNQCEGNKEDEIPPCVKACPEYPKGRKKFTTAEGKTIRYRYGATYKRPDGLILFASASRSVPMVRGPGISAASRAKMRPNSLLSNAPFVSTGLIRVWSPRV
jgi:tetrathionate reductase subunit B